MPRLHLQKEILMACKVSSSQMVAHEACPRKWYFQSVAKLRVESSTPQALGTALHLLCAAYLLGQEWPDDWSRGLTPNEVELCREFMSSAVNSGVLRRRPNLAVEVDFKMAIGPDDLTGRIDLMDPAGVIEDHKTVASRRWAKRPDDLVVDIPMMTYAGYLLSCNRTITGVTLRHNQFFKDDGSVDFVEVFVTRDAVRDFWKANINQIVERMRSDRTKASFAEVEGRPDGSEACRAYGGCAYSPICHGGVSLADFKQRDAKTREVPF